MKHELKVLGEFFPFVVICVCKCCDNYTLSFDNEIQEMLQRNSIVKPTGVSHATLHDEILS